MLPNLQTLPLNPHPSVNSISQMSWSPIRWIVLCPSTNHSWMHSKPFTSIRQSGLRMSSLSTPTLTLKRISSKQRGHAYPRQIMRMNCSWSVGRARCIKWLMKCYSTMSMDLWALCIWNIFVCIAWCVIEWEMTMIMIVYIPLPIILYQHIDRMDSLHNVIHPSIHPLVQLCEEQQLVMMWSTWMLLDVVDGDFTGMTSWMCECYWLI